MSFIYPFLARCVPKGRVIREVSGPKTIITFYDSKKVIFEFKISPTHIKISSGVETEWSGSRKLAADAPVDLANLFYSYHYQPGEPDLEYVRENMFTRMYPIHFKAYDAFKVLMEQTGLSYEYGGSSVLTGGRYMFENSSPGTLILFEDGFQYRNKKHAYVFDVHEGLEVFSVGSILTEIDIVWKSEQDAVRNFIFVQAAIFDLVPDDPGLMFLRHSPFEEITLDRASLEEKVRAAGEQLDELLEGISPSHKHHLPHEVSRSCPEKKYEWTIFGGNQDYHNVSFHHEGETTRAGFFQGSPRDARSIYNIQYIRDIVAGKSKEEAETARLAFRTEFPPFKFSAVLEGRGYCHCDDEDDSPHSPYDVLYEGDPYDVDDSDDSGRADENEN